MEIKCKLGIHKYKRKHQALNNNTHIQCRECVFCGKLQYSSDKTHKIWKD